MARGLIEWQERVVMAYRFMLEVPADERRSAEIAVGRVPETQIVVSRESFPEGFDVPFGALTISSDQLPVVQTIYSWYESREGRDDRYRVVLNSGARMRLDDYTPGQVIAAIRRDQPWIEHAVPRIGDHIEEGPVNDPFGSAVESAFVDEASERLRGPMATASTESAKTIGIQQVNYVAVNVPDLRKAERFYADLLETEIVARTRRAEDGAYRLIDPEFMWNQVMTSETRPTDTFLRNGPLVIAIHEVGSGARLERTVLDRVSIQVDGGTWASLRGQVLMRSLELIQDSELSFVFRDPYGVPWEITVAGLLPEVVRKSLRDAF